MMGCKSGDIAVPATGIAGFKTWLAEAWPTALPLCALLVASLAPVVVLTFIFMGSPIGAITVIVSTLAAILALSLLSRLRVPRGHPTS
jgi:phage-related protein